MADINFDCPHCGHNLEVSERGAGLTVACPECSKNIEIPVPELRVSDIVFNCGSCRQPLKALPEMAGQLIDCPSCKKPTEIPFASGLTPATPTSSAARSTPIPKPPSQKQVPGTGTSDPAAPVATRPPKVTSGSTVKIDTSDEVANLYKIARRARNDKNNENAAKYYDMILVKDANSWEAQFYVVYCQAMSWAFSIESAALRVNNCVNTVLDLIKETYDDPDERYKCVDHIAARVIEIESLLYNAEENYFQGLWGTQNEYMRTHIANVWATKEALYNSGDVVEAIFADDPNICEIAALLWRAGISQHAELVKYLAKKDANIDTINKYANKVKKYDPEYKTPEISTSSDCDFETCFVLIVFGLGIAAMISMIVLAFRELN